MAGRQSGNRLLAPVPALRAPAVQLFLTSATILFVELLVIRWIPSNVLYVGFFSNFLLMGSFLGIGLGILAGRRSPDLRLSPFPLLLFATVVLVLNAELNVELNPESEIFFGLELNQSADVNFLVLPLVVTLAVALMATLSLPLGPLLGSMPPLRAYAVDIAGSMAGVAAFAALSALTTQPPVWFALTAALLLLQGLGRGLRPSALLSGAAMLACVVLTASAAAQSLDTWSPYYRISAYDTGGNRVDTRLPDARPVYLFVDGIPHQAISGAEETLASPLHAQVGRWFPERRWADVLVIGAGSGTDSGLFRRQGASRIDAVEIDPELARIGRQFHPDDVYGHPGVEVVVNDGRAFLRNTGKKYDLIVFALTDSLTLVSSTANLRLESFLYTVEAMREARTRLSDDGLFVMYNIYREPWLVAKLAAMVEAAFNERPVVRLLGRAEAVIAAGPALDATGGSPPADRTDPAPDVKPLKLATDDWPFLYLREPAVAPYYLAALGFLLATALVALTVIGRRTGMRRADLSPHFFVLGIAFLLLQTKSIVSFSLLFGSTWLVNALTIFAILASVLLAIVVNARWRVASWLAYMLLGAGIAVAWLVPPETLLIEPPWLRYLLAAGIAFAPVFAANLVFTQSFRDTRMADFAFASNLLGAVVGGALEYLALVTGFQFLLIVVATLYVVAWALGGPMPVLADRQLSPRARA